MTSPPNGIAILAALLIAQWPIAPIAGAQQVGDPDYQPEIENPAYDRGQGPVVAIDEGHHNFHTRTGRYAPFARLLEADGYRVRSHRGEVSERSLDGTDILVIVNALHASNVNQWELPTPSAFSDKEIEAIAAFVAGGGSLFLIADHMPFPGAIETLAAKFGARFENGFNAAKTGDGLSLGQVRFKRDTGGIAAHPITDGHGGGGRIDQVTSFTGSAFRLDGDATSAKPLLVLAPGTHTLNPKRAWKFSEETEKKDVSGWLQGAAIEHGEGRVVIFAEAAMFSAQRSGNRRMGMHAEGVGDNQQLARNILRWLGRGQLESAPEPP